MWEKKRTGHLNNKTHKPLPELRAHRLTKKRATELKLTKVGQQFRTCAFCHTMYTETKYATQCEHDAEAIRTAQIAETRRKNKK